MDGLFVGGAASALVGVARWSLSLALVLGGLGLMAVSFVLLGKRR